ncbi:YdeI/OmpD-associated family protein [Pedobacter sp. Leaf132]|uniref:YdeI/OmpD-associated family protein n=1 Tax=Pedobacter sp. Leaf132 TaxID=2876557 RepID=UPI001E28B6EF|nr:YdeI/OmpD-associated family protein [Pedobacter sp. Leaf132]
MEHALLKKLQIKPGFVVKVIDAPENVDSIFLNKPDNISICYDEVNHFDALITFTTSQNQLKAQIESQLMYLNPKTIIWIFSPKKSSKIKTDLDLMKSWHELDVFGLNPCSSASVNEIWTALRLKFIGEIKPSGLRNDHIQTNDYSDFIDVVNKKVTLPSGLKFVLEQHPQAIRYFESLAYSNKKEYVLWILSAKQEKTRQARIDKVLIMLLDGKKNPSA